MTDEQQGPADEEVLAASTEPEPGVSDEEAEDDDLLDLVEPPDASRLSPYAVAAFALSLLALFSAPQALFALRGRGSAVADILLAVIPQLVVPVAGALIVLWLVRRAEDEIFFGEGRFGGVGFYRSARVLAIVILAISVLALLFGVLLGPERPPMPG